MLLAGRESLSRVLMHGGRAPITHVYAFVRACVHSGRIKQANAHQLYMCVCINIFILLYYYIMCVQVNTCPKVPVSVRPHHRDSQSAAG